MGSPDNYKMKLYKDDIAFFNMEGKIVDNIFFDLGKAVDWHLRGAFDSNCNSARLIYEWATYSGTVITLTLAWNDNHCIIWWGVISSYMAPSTQYSSAIYSN